MKKKLWVSRDKDGYGIWTVKPLFSPYSDDVDVYHNGGSMLLNKINTIDMTYPQFKKALHGCDVKLKMNQLKRIELTITAEVKEI